MVSVRPACSIHLPTIRTSPITFTSSPLIARQLSDGSVWMPDIDREMGVSRELPNERFGVNRDNQRVSTAVNPH